MQNDVFNKFMFIGAVLVGVGLLFIFASGNWGLSLADGWLAKYDYADSATYEFKIGTNTNNFLVVGGILFGVGLVTTLICYFKIEDKKK